MVPIARHHYYIDFTKASSEEMWLDVLHDITLMDCCALQMHLLFAGAFQMRQNYVPKLLVAMRDYCSTITSNKLSSPA